MSLWDEISTLLIFVGVVIVIASVVSFYRDTH
jgi:hypothetical protein